MIDVGTVASRPTQPVGSRIDRPSAGIPMVAVPPGAEEPADGGAEGAPDATADAAADCDGPATDEPADGRADVDGARDSAGAPVDPATDGAPDDDEPAAIGDDGGVPEAAPPMDDTGVEDEAPPQLARTVLRANSARATPRRRGIVGDWAP